MLSRELNAVRALIKDIGYAKALILIVLIVVAIFIVGGWAGSKLTANINLHNYEYPQATVPAAVFSSIPPIKINEGVKDFENTKSEWIIHNYDAANEDGYLCAQNNQKFPAPEIWFKNSIPLFFTSLKFTYRVAVKNRKAIPPFIISIGEGDNRIARFSSHELNPRLVGFDRFIVKNSILIPDREKPPSEFSQSVESNAPVEISVRSIPLQGNQAQLLFNVSYISAQTGDTVVDILKYEVKILNPDPLNLRIKIGFGTTVGNCIKLISYEFNY